MSKSYFVHYVKDCSPIMKKFNSKAAATKFYNNLVANSSIDQGDWADFLLEGSVLDASMYYAEHIKTKKVKSNKKTE